MYTNFKRCAKKKINAFMACEIQPTGCGFNTALRLRYLDVSNEYSIKNYLSIRLTLLRNRLGLF